MESKASAMPLDGSNMSSEPRHRSRTIYKKGIDAQTLNTKNIRHSFNYDDIILPGNGSAEESGPPSPHSGTPPRYGQVEPGIYRSSFPQDVNVSFLSDLNLKTIVTLVDTDFSPEVASFMDKNSIRHYQVKIPPHKEKTDAIPPERITQVLKLLLDPSKHPLLIHCNKGKHRTGCMVACYRKVQGLENSKWDLNRTLTEYHKYADSKARAYDEAFISGFDAKEALESVKASHTSTLDSISDSSGGVGIEGTNGRTGADCPEPSESNDIKPAGQISAGSGSGLDTDLLLHALQRLTIQSTSPSISTEESETKQASSVPTQNGRTQPSASHVEAETETGSDVDKNPPREN